MQVTLLGTGSAMPLPHRAQTGVLIEHDGTTVLIDAGSGVLGRLATESETTGEPRYETLDAVVLSHHHLDHVADLLPLCKARWLAGVGGLPVYGPAGTEALIDDILEVHEYLRGRFELEITELEPGDKVEIGQLRAETRQTVHSMPCLAFRVSGEESGTVVVSGDTEADSDLVRWADGADVLIHDCSFPDGVDVSNHPTPTSLGAALAGSSFGTVYLTHLYPAADLDTDVLVEGVKSEYDGRVVVAKDGLSFRL